MDSDRPPPPNPNPNRTLTTPTSSSTSELFICFTSRLPPSSSSMRISKSILSPGRAARDPPISLSTSLSRRLRTSGSIKGGASPAMFPTTGKKRGSFENPEPSSPKVTCIGQVRVKTKRKQGKKLRTLSRRHSTGEVSFRKLEHVRDGFSSQSQNLVPNYQPGGNNQDCFPGQRNNNQRWVHLPLTICEALRAFGSEFSCLFPCRSSCFSTAEREKDEKSAAATTGTGSGEQEGNRQGSCGAVFARWLVALQDGDGGGRGGGREIELVVGGDEEEDEEEMSVRNSRRHVFEDLEIVNDRIQGRDEERVSICIPPKNALLLMRCRSDPMKMEALANRFWEPSLGKNEEEEDEEFLDQDNIVDSKEDLEIEQHKEEEEKVMVMDEINQDKENAITDEAKQQHEERGDLDMEMKQSMDVKVESEQQSTEINKTEDVHHDQGIAENEEESMFLVSLFGEFVDQDQEIQENEEAVMVDAQQEWEEALEPETGESNTEKVKDSEEEEEEEIVTQFAERSEAPEQNEVLERERQEKERESSSRVLPECLLLMMCEPKLSMEVSRETWVCSTDFIRRPSDRKKPPPPPRPPVKSVDGQDKVSPVNNTTITTSSSTLCDNHAKKAAAAAAQHQPVVTQPRRSSCSLPPTMATVLEQKLVNAVGYEPFVLTRCKSEPMRTAAAKLAPESCFWKNRKLEPLRRATFGVGGAAGLGF